MIDWNDHYRLREDYDALSTLARNLGQTLSKEATRVKDGNLPDNLLMERLNDFNCLSTELAKNFSEISEREFGQSLPKEDSLSLQSFQKLLSTMPTRADALVVLEELKEQNDKARLDPADQKKRFEEIDSLYKKVMGLPLLDLPDFVHEIVERVHPICEIPAELEPEIDEDELEGFSGTFTIPNPLDSALQDTQVLMSELPEDLLGLDKADKKDEKKSDKKDDSVIEFFGPDENLVLDSNQVAEKDDTEIDNTDETSFDKDELFSLLDSLDEEKKEFLEEEFESNVPSLESGENDLEQIAQSLIPKNPESESSLVSSEEDLSLIFDDVEITGANPLQTLDSLVKSQSGNAGKQVAKEKEKPLNDEKLVGDILWEIGQKEREEEIIQKISTLLPTSEDKKEIQELASNAKTASGLERDSNVAKLIWKLSSMSQLGPAYHLAKILESRSPMNSGLSFPPSWMLRAIALAPKLYFSQGKIAQQVDFDLSNFLESQFSKETTETKEAFDFLLHAAAFRTAIINPTKSSWAILRSFEISEGLSQLYNFTRRITSFGSKNERLTPEVFSPIIGQTQSLRKALNRDMEVWGQDISENSLKFNTATPLFNRGNWSLLSSRISKDEEFAQSWGECQPLLTAANQLLEPVRFNDLSSRTEVRQTMSRLAEKLRSSSHVTAYESSLLGNTQDLVQRALSIAERWLIVSAEEVSESSFIPESVSSLKNELLNRHDLVCEELLAKQRETPSPIVQDAIQCCLRAVYDINALFNQKTSLPVVEDNPHRVLNSELLKIPQIELDDSWQPKLNLDALEEEILHHLELEEVDWSAAFHMHCTHNNHVATRRLLQLDVWKSETERSKLSEIRDRDIDHCKEMMQQEFVSSYQAINQAQELGILEEHEHKSLSSRVKRLESSLPQILNFSKPMYELHQINRTLEHRRQKEMQKTKDRLNMLSQQSGKETFNESEVPESTGQKEISDKKVTDGDSEWILDIF